MSLGKKPSLTQDSLASWYEAYIGTTSRGVRCMKCVHPGVPATGKRNSGLSLYVLLDLFSWACGIFVLRGQATGYICEYDSDSAWL